LSEDDPNLLHRPLTQSKKTPSISGSLNKRHLQRPYHQNLHSTHLEVPLEIPILLIRGFDKRAIRMEGKTDFCIALNPPKVYRGLFSFPFRPKVLSFSYKRVPFVWVTLLEGCGTFGRWWERIIERILTHFSLYTKGTNNSHSKSPL